MRLAQLVAIEQRENLRYRLQDARQYGRAEEDSERLSPETIRFAILDNTLVPHEGDEWWDEWYTEH